MLKRLVIAIVFLTLSATCGCALLEKQPEASKKSKDWDKVRGRIKTQLAQRNFEADHLEEALRQCGQALSLDSESMESYLLMARIMLAKDKNAQAATVLEQAGHLGTKSPELDYLRGVVAERDNQTKLAVEFYKQAYQADWENHDYLITYAESLLRAGRLEPMVDLLRSRQADFDEDPVIFLLLGQAFSLLDRADEAADALAMAVQLAPGNHLLREETTLALLDAGRLSEAVHTLRPLLAASAEDIDPQTIRSVASSLMEQEQFQAALAVLEPALKVHTDDAWCWLLSAQAHVALDQKSKAESALLRALQENSQLTEARLLQAWFKLADGEPRKAAIEARQILKHHPHDAEAQAILARAQQLQ